MILQSLPDAPWSHPFLSLGRDYEILGTLGNCYVIQPENYPDKIVILASRFADAIPLPAAQLYHN